MNVIWFWFLIFILTKKNISSKVVKKVNFVCNFMPTKWNFLKILDHMTRPGDLWCRLLKKKEEKNVSEMFFHHFHHFWSGENGHKMVSFVPSKNLFKQIFKYEQLTLGCFSTHKRAESPLMGGETPCSRHYGSRTNSTIVIQWWQW